jgi:hypothetical protein
VNRHQPSKWSKPPKTILLIHKHNDERTIQATSLLLEYVPSPSPLDLIKLTHTYYQKLPPNIPPNTLNPSRTPHPLLSTLPLIQKSNLSQSKRTSSLTWDCRIGDHVRWGWYGFTYEWNVWKGGMSTGGLFFNGEFGVFIAFS